MSVPTNNPASQQPTPELPPAGFFGGNANTQPDATPAIDVATQAANAVAQDADDLPPPPATPANSFETPPGTGADPTQATTSQVHTQAPNAERAEIDALSEQYSIDLSSFNNRNDALAAVRLVAEQFAQAGLQQQQAPPQNTQQPAAPAPAAPNNADSFADLNLDDPDLDPRITTALKAMKAETEAARQTALEASQQLDGYVQQSQESQRAELQQRAAAAVDTLQSSKYGVGNQRTFAQQLATENLFRIADTVVAGMTARGAEIPTVETILNMAAQLDGYTPEPTPNQPAPQTPAAPDSGAAYQFVPPAVPVQPQAAPAPVQQYAGLQPRPAAGSGGTETPVRRTNSARGGDKLLSDAEFMAGARAILRR